MLFDTLPSGNENIVIVPPKPDAFLSHHDEFSYSNLYSYEGGVGEVSYASCSNNYGAPSTTPLSTVAVSASASSTSNSSFTISERSSTVSFDSSAFDRPSCNNIQKPPPTLRSASNSGTSGTNVITRDEKHNGAFTFQVHAEYDLLLHVQKDLDRHRNRADRKTGKKLTNIQLSKLIMRSIDEYCLQKQWMYHIGNNKGTAIGRFLEESLKMKKRNGSTTKVCRVFACLNFDVAHWNYVSSLIFFIQNSKSHWKSLHASI